MAKTSTFREEVRGVIYFPFLNKLHPKSNKYSICLGQLDKATAERLKEAGGKIDKTDDRGYSIGLKNKERALVLDAQLKELTEDQKGRVGAGTQAIVQVVIIPTEFQNAAQAFDGIQVLKLVEYTGGSRLSFQKQEGFVATDDPVAKKSEDWEEAVD